LTFIGRVLRCGTIAKHPCELKGDSAEHDSASKGG
jgi:hypothetical protein